MAAPHRGLGSMHPSQACNTHPYMRRSALPQTTARPPPRLLLLPSNDSCSAGNNQTKIIAKAHGPQLAAMPGCGHTAPCQAHTACAWKPLAPQLNNYKPYELAHHAHACAAATGPNTVHALLALLGAAPALLHLPQLAPVHHRHVGLHEGK